MHRLLFLLVIFTFATFFTIITSSEITIPKKFNEEEDLVNSYPKSGVSYRLPNTSLPLTYDVAINWTDDETFNFNGRVKIKIMIIEYTNKIVIHKKYIDIESVYLSSFDFNELEFPISWTYSNITDFLTISYSEYFDIGSKLLLDVTYTGKLRSDDHGFFYQSYTAENGEQRQV